MVAGQLGAGHAGRPVVAAPAQALRRLRRNWRCSGAPLVAIATSAQVGAVNGGRLVRHHRCADCRAAVKLQATPRSMTWPCWRTTQAAAPMLVTFDLKNNQLVA